MIDPSACRATGFRFQVSGQLWAWAVILDPALPGAVAHLYTAGCEIRVKGSSLTGSGIGSDGAGSACLSENRSGPLTAESFTRRPNHPTQIPVVVGHEVREAHPYAG